MMNVKIDALDRQIIALLQKDSSVSAEDGAQMLQKSVSTVRRRIKALTDASVIGTRVVVDPKQIGLPLAVIVAVDVAPNRLKSVTDELAAREEVTWVASTAGRYDVLISARFKDGEELTRFLEDTLGKTDGVRNSETFMLLRTRRRRFFEGKGDRVIE